MPVPPTCPFRHATRSSKASAKSDRIPDSQFYNYSDIDPVANTGHHST
ncbi:MAG: hypothetical protein F6J94_08985 [Moorea sp. SIO1F2]|nr:hypothetical protein [Moorena sp. SIO1F2]NET82066.1 hypothetical protein [Moorena sp. SIO1F2]